MCSNCKGDYENPDLDLVLCPQCGHDQDLHDELGCQHGLGTETRCRCELAAWMLNLVIDIDDGIYH